MTTTSSCSTAKIRRCHIRGKRTGISSLVAALLVLASLILFGSASGGGTTMRIITEEELAGKKGAGGKGDIWLSVLGTVFDVTASRRIYGEGGSKYKVFAGIDGSASYHSGDFTERGVRQDIHDFTDEQLASIAEWKSFFVNEHKYPMVGLLEGQYYDKEGNPTEHLLSIKDRLTAHYAAKKEETLKRQKDLPARLAAEAEEKKRREEMMAEIYAEEERMMEEARKLDEERHDGDEWEEDDEEWDEEWDEDDEEWDEDEWEYEEEEEEGEDVDEDEDEEAVKKAQEEARIAAEERKAKFEKKFAEAKRRAEMEKAAAKENGDEL